LYRRFRYVLQKFKINEKEVVKELEDVLIEGVQHGYNERLADWLGTKVDLTEIERYTILDSMVDLRKSATKNSERRWIDIMKSLKGVKGETIPDEIETIYDHELTEEERAMVWGLSIFYPKTKEEYLQKLRERYKTPKAYSARFGKIYSYYTLSEGTGLRLKSI
jgi:hypothetical protein